MMLCDSCQHQETCLLPQLAAHDRQVQTMLEQLKVCEMYLARFPVGVAWEDGMHRLWALGQHHLAGMAEGVSRLLKAGLKDKMVALILVKH